MNAARMATLAGAFPALLSVVRCALGAAGAPVEEPKEEPPGAYLGSLVVKRERSLEGDCLSPLFEQQRTAYSAQVTLARPGDGVVVDLAPAVNKGEWPPITKRLPVPWTDTLFVTVTCAADPAVVRVYSVAIEARLP